MTNTVETPKTSRFATMVENAKPSNLSDEKKAKVRRVMKTIITAGAVAVSIAAVVVTTKALSADTGETESSSESTDEINETPENE